MSALCARIMVLVLPALVLSACGGDGSSEIREWMDAVKKDTRVFAPKLSPPKVYVPVAYSGKGEIDPFDPAKLLAVLARLNAGSDKGLRPDMNRRRESLEGYPLDALKMVGTIRSEKDRIERALIQNEKTVYQVRVGNYIGQNFGLITKISDDGIDIKEIVQDAAGDWVERQAKLELQENKK